MRDSAIRLGRFVVVVYLIVGAWGTMASAEPAGDPDGRVVFDIPAQPLASALDAYSAATGMDILYDSALTEHLRSADVSGAQSTRTALSSLLEGSGLVARPISPGAITIIPREGEAPRPPGPEPGRDSHRAYFALIQAGFVDAFCREGGDMDLGRLVLRFGIGPSGAITRPEVVGVSGGSSRYQAITRVLRRVRLAKPPPADMPQPITMLIRPSISRDLTCPGP